MLLRTAEGNRIRFARLSNFSKSHLLTEGGRENRRERNPRQFGAACGALGTKDAEFKRRLLPYNFLRRDVVSELVIVSIVSASSHSCPGCILALTASRLRERKSSSRDFELGDLECSMNMIKSATLLLSNSLPVAAQVSNPSPLILKNHQ